ncbi:2-phospho-L-lactate guanylyltransferase [Herbiconiux sp. A18JL235]|uniref:Phosphoenolpyruvate guanylyltransferase n=1 Tax=Herbiconiux sp. A18JL235 TaxID=3152363 RepID=A0AB39BK08_9MICO
MSDAAAVWTVVVPVKGTPAGKSRMSPGVDSALRALLAEAFALDTLAAVRDTPSVGRLIVVTDPEAGPATARRATALRIPDVEIVPDPGSGLNAAVIAGLGAAGDAHRAVLLGDLPALVPHDLEEALAAAETHPLAVVPDAQGTGTTLVTARPGAVLIPRFGAGSARRHREAGHVVLDVPADSTLRLDVDTEADLAEAVARGVGAHTRRALAPAELSPPAVRAPSPRR